MGRAFRRPETFMYVDRFVFTGLSVEHTSENESAIIFRRCLRINRACVIARRKSLKWLHQSKWCFELRRLAAVERLVNKYN